MKNYELKEASRCLRCVNKPCMNGCPLNNDIPKFLELVKYEHYEEAFHLLCNTTVLPAVCGRICPYDKQCKSTCTRRYKETAIDINVVESFIGDLALENDWQIPIIDDKFSGKKFAIIGGGPSGLSAAAYLRRMGATVTIYEKKEKLGGILNYGIPDFRLDKKIVDASIEKILKLGITVHTNADVDIKKILEEYDRIYLAIGAKVSRRKFIDGENLKGVIGGNELLENGCNFDFKGKNVIVCGGGNVAIDSARSIKRLGAENVTIVYRRDEAAMPAEKIEIANAKVDGVRFNFNTNLVKILGGDIVSAVQCIKTQVTNSHVLEIEDSKFVLECDYVIIAIGSKPDLDLIYDLGLEANENGYLRVDEFNKTSNEKIFAGGDLIGEKATVAWAMRSGRDAAINMLNSL